ncbi:hypothetical protein BJ322DRAFT_1112587 [Thelephora terrestris]|uniref:CxC2-like cysteine cluster KDZ transposase-associated domain-containing protein n=1 Tax=Thelephora terrestris TaxID=56493 RepID=A0A9P6H7B1_9AGAM|nr:hypothetical protein BJ322DRAFT_1112587 [Thelephora terrestris]
MFKREGGLTHSGNPKVKKRKGVKIRTVIIPDSDEESPTPNVKMDYARLVQTHVTASGKVGSVTATSVPFVEAAEYLANGSMLDIDNDPNLASDIPIHNVVPEMQVTKMRRKRGNDSTKMKSWLGLRSAVLDEIISLDGPGDARTDLCGLFLNHEEPPLYRCLECSYGSLSCGECAVVLHQTMPLHRLECWKDGFFDRASLHSPGFVCNLGHEGAACPVGSQPHELLIVNINGWHKLRVRYCNCGASKLRLEHYYQLLQMHWYL